MKATDKIDLNDVGALIRQLSQRVIIPQRFSLEATEPEMCNLIYACMTVEAGIRGRDLKLDQATRDHITHAAQWLIDPKGKPGLLCMGLYGNGKTTLMKAIKRAILFLSEQMSGYDPQRTVRYVKARQIAAWCKDQTTRQEYRKLLAEPMLAIDDLGEEPAEVIDYGMSYLPLADLLSERYDCQLFTMVTTNLTPKEIVDKYGKRIADRFNEMMEVVIFENDSYRKIS